MFFCISLRQIFCQFHLCFKYFKKIHRERLAPPAPPLLLVLTLFASLSQMFKQENCFSSSFARFEVLPVLSVFSISAQEEASVQLNGFLSHSSVRWQGFITVYCNSFSLSIDLFIIHLTGCLINIKPCH